MTSVVNGREPLTARERGVLCLIAEGLPDQEICERLSIKRGTLETHKASIYSKYHVRSRIQAVRHGLAYGDLHLCDLHLCDLLIG